jgi:hypothetical protein
MEIEEFLRACVAEDRAPTWTLVPYDCPPGCCAPEGWMGAQCRYCDPAPVYGGTLEAMTRSAEEHAEAIHQRSHVLAECDAKLLIVDTYVDMEELGGTERIEQRLTLRYAMQCLALPYADRPGYREEWRV